MSSLRSKIESIFFISHQPVSVKRIAMLINDEAEEKIPQKEIKDAAESLLEEYQTEKRGVQIIKVDDQFQMVSSPENSDLVKKMVKSDFSGELTQPSLETLTIIAYRGPVSKTEIEQIRGVNCSLIIRNLLIRGLVQEVEGPDPLMLYYQITPEFLKYLGIRQQSELSDYQNLNQNELLKEFLEKEQEKRERETGDLK